MTDDKALKRVKELIALSSSSEEQEARTSALLACQLIRKYAFEVVKTRSLPPQPKPPPRRPNPPTTPRRPVPGSASGPVNGPRVSSSPFEGAVHWSNDFPTNEPSMITIAFEGKCNACGKKVPAFSNVWWIHGTAYVHLDCDPSVLRR